MQKEKEEGKRGCVAVCVRCCCCDAIWTLGREEDEADGLWRGRTDEKKKHSAAVLFPSLLCRQPHSRSPLPSTAAAMAENLARIYGTEEDKVNCPFYFKVRFTQQSSSSRRQRSEAAAASICVCAPWLLLHSSLTAPPSIAAVLVPSLSLCPPPLLSSP